MKIDLHSDRWTDHHLKASSTEANIWKGKPKERERSYQTWDEAEHWKNIWRDDSEAWQHIEHLPSPNHPFLCKTSQDRILLEKSSHENKIAFSWQLDFQKMKGKDGPVTGRRREEAAEYKSLTLADILLGPIDHTNSLVEPVWVMPFPSKQFTASSHDGRRREGKHRSSLFIQIGAEDDHARISLFQVKIPLECKKVIRSGGSEDSSPYMVESMPRRTLDPEEKRHFKKPRKSAWAFLRLYPFPTPGCSSCTSEPTTFPSDICV